MTPRRVILAAVAIVAFGYAAAARRPTAGDESMQLLQWTTRASEYLRLGRTLADLVSSYAAHAQHAATTASALVAVAAPTQSRAQPVDAAPCRFVQLPPIRPDTTFIRTEHITRSSAHLVSWPTPHPVAGAAAQPGRAPRIMFLRNRS